jgi:hypothetical protein
MPILQRATAGLIATSLLTLAAPGLSQAQVEEIDFSGVTSQSQSNITPGTVVPQGYLLPSTFTGSFLYDPSANSHFITDVVLNYGTFQLAQSNSLVDAGSAQIQNGTVTYGNSISTGLTGALAGLEINGFEMMFAGPTNGQVPTAPGSINFSDFTTKTVEFDAAGFPNGGEVHDVGDITSIKVPEPSTLPLCALLLAVPLILGLKRRRAQRAM